MRKRQASSRSNAKKAARKRSTSQNAKTDLPGGQFNGLPMAGPNDPKCGAIFGGAYPCQLKPHVPEVKHFHETPAGSRVSWSSGGPLQEA